MEFTLLDHINDGTMAWWVWGDGNFIYVADGLGGIRAYTFIGGTLVNVGSIDALAQVVSIHGDGAHLYTADGTVGLSAWDFDGSIFNKIDTILDGGTPNEAMCVWCHGGFIYLGNNGDGIAAYSLDGGTLTNRGRIKIVSHQPPALGSGRGIWHDGAVIFVANYGDGIRAFTHDGANFVCVGHLDVGGSGFSVHGAGGYIYMANWSNLLAYTYAGGVFVNVGSIILPGQARCVWCYGSRVFVGDGSGGLYALEFDGAIFSEIAHVDPGEHAFGVWSDDGSTILMANRLGGLYAYALGAAATQMTATAPAVTTAEASLSLVGNYRFMGHSKGNIHQPFF